jgi:hypothetical protein
MPQYLTLYTPAVPSDGPPSAAHMTAMGKLIEKMNARNALVTMGATIPGSTSVRLTKGAYAVADLPRTGEQGFAILNAKDKDDMIAMVREFLAVAGDGECACHPLMAPPPQS